MITLLWNVRKGSDHDIGNMPGTGHSNDVSREDIAICHEGWLADLREGVFDFVKVTYGSRSE